MAFESLCLMLDTELWSASDDIWRPVLKQVKVLKFIAIEAVYYH